MQSSQRVPEETHSSALHIQPSYGAVHATLQAILQSQPFRTSKQCQNLLKYIVEHSLRDDDSSLRERILGIEVFGRSPDYDTSEDPVVRMRAADVRKRLAQYYQASDPGISQVHISLKPGSYRATFHSDPNPTFDRPVAAEIVGPHPFPAPAGTPHLAPLHVIDLMETAEIQAIQPVQPIAHSRRKTVLLVSAMLAAILLSFGGWRLWALHFPTPQQRFWAPLTRSSQPVLLYVGANAVYRFTSEYMTKYQKEHNLAEGGPEFYPDLPKGATVSTNDLVAVKDSFVSVADLAASVQVATLMNSWNKPINLRSASDLSIGDIRNMPAVLIGGFNDSWALQTTNDLPFSFREGVKILNRKDPAHSWVVFPNNTTGMTEDFALISRIQHSNTGGPVISIGGIGSFGTQAAAEFVVNPDKMNDLLKTAPAGWEGKNMQAVLRIKVVDFEPVAIDVVATDYW